MTTAGAIQATIDLGPYIEVMSKLGVEVLDASYIFQAFNTGVTPTIYNGFVTSAFPIALIGGCIDIQLTDLNRGSVIVSGNDRSIVSSASLNFNQVENTYYLETDLQPDTFGKDPEGRIVITDSLTLTGKASAVPTAGEGVRVSVRLKCRSIKLTENDWMQLAVSSTAAE
jgi:hypothetical protein